MKDVPFNVLADRYAGTPMVDIWAPRNRILQERKLWLAALRAMQDAGYSGISPQALRRYEEAIEDIDLDWISAREKETRHDVKAKIEAFNRAAGNTGKDELIHQGFTSRDLTDNVEQMLIKQSLELVLWKSTALLSEMVGRAALFKGIAICARTHNVAAQATTLGKRFASIAEELMFHMDALDGFLAAYSLRGIKGPVGTQQDMLELLGSEQEVLNFERQLAKHLGFDNVFVSVGQIPSFARLLDNRPAVRIGGCAFQHGAQHPAHGRS